MQRVVCLIVAVLFAAGFSGCALTTDKIDIVYTPQENVAPISGADKVSVNVQVADQRQEKSKVSCKKNGFGMEMAPIIANEDVTVTIRKAMEQELVSRGFRIVPADAVVKIAADVTRFYNDHKTGFFSGDAVADMNMSVMVKSHGGDILYSRQIVAQGIEENTQLMTGNNARKALTRALENGMKMLFDDAEFLAALMAVFASESE